MKAQAHKMAHRYSTTANSSVHGRGLANKNRAVIWTMNTPNSAKKTAPPRCWAARARTFMRQRVLLMRSSMPLVHTLA